MVFNKIDMDLWERSKYFRHFMDDVRCVLCMTDEVDVTDLVRQVKARGYRFYPTFIYIVSKLVNDHREFRMSYDKDGNVGYYDQIWPVYTIFHKECETYTRLYSRYYDNFNEFYGNCVADMEACKDVYEVSVPDIPGNTFDVSCLPWISYKSLDVHVFDSGTYLAPVITWGKHHEVNGRIMMPLTMQIHHAAADGFHVARFFHEIQQTILEMAESLAK